MANCSTVKHPYRNDEVSYDKDELDEENSSCEPTNAVVTGDASSSYPTNIAAACQKASVACRQPKANAAEDAIRLEKRRKSNRQSAQRWRMRKRSKFSDLQEQIRLLQKDQEKLEGENSKLQAELQVELALARTESTHLSPALVAARLRRSEETLAISRNVVLATKLDILNAAQLSPHLQSPVNPSFQSNLQMLGMPSFRLQGATGRCANQVVPNIGPSLSILAQRPNSMLSPLVNPLTGNGVSMAELREMLRTATS